VRAEASVVIIGGGIIGTAIAFYLCKKGMKDVVLVEKSYLSSGSTGRCGGGIRQQWSERMNVRLAMRSVKLFERFEEEIGMDIEYYQGGYLLLAYTDEEVELLKLATFCPTDGHANPHLATMAYAKAAEKMGAMILTHTEVTDIDVQSGQIKGVLTTKGYIKTSVVVNAAGGFSREVGLMAGVELPTESYRHQIFVTEPLEHILDPLVISFVNNFYIRQTKSGNFIMGQGDKDEPPSHKHDPSWKFLTEMTEKMPHFFPFLKEVRVLRHWAGLYNMSPDAQPIIDKSEIYQI